METWTNTCGPIPGLILTQTHLGAEGNLDQHLGFDGTWAFAEVVGGHPVEEVLGRGSRLLQRHLNEACPVPFCQGNGMKPTGRCVPTFTQQLECMGVPENSVMIKEHKARGLPQEEVSQVW